MGSVKWAQEDLHLRNQQMLHTGTSTEPLPGGLVVNRLPAHHCMNTPPPDGQGARDLSQAGQKLDFWQNLGHEAFGLKMPCSLDVNY